MKYIDQSMKEVCAEIEIQQSWEDEQFMRELDETLEVEEEKGNSTYYLSTKGSALCINCGDAHPFSTNGGRRAMNCTGSPLVCRNCHKKIPSVGKRKK